jgi:hypothetical protein
VILQTKLYPFQSYFHRVFITSKFKGDWFFDLKISQVLDFHSLKFAILNNYGSHLYHIKYTENDNKIACRGFSPPYSWYSLHLCTEKHTMLKTLTFKLILRTKSYPSLHYFHSVLNTLNIKR